VNSEGMGHAIRSKVVIDYLSKKHNLFIVSGDGRAKDYLAKHFKTVYAIPYISLSYKDNELKIRRSVAQNLKKITELKRVSSKGFRKAMAEIKEFNPDLVISDAEPFMNFYAIFKKIPIIEINNISIIERCKLDIPKHNKLNYLIAKEAIKKATFGARCYIIPTFFYPKQVKKNTYLVPPVLRKDILNLKPTGKDNILVYQTSDNHSRLVSTLKKINQKFIVYGFNKAGKSKNVVFRKFNEGQFFRDFADCKAVITNGGFTLITEAIYLKKPILSIPVKKQFEQITNAHYLEKLGYGEYHKDVNLKRIEKFLYNCDVYAQTLKRYEQKDNKILFNRLDKVIMKLSKSSRF